MSEEVKKYIDQLKTDKSTLVSNLTDKGVEATDTETFTELVPKVADIPIGENIENYISSASDEINKTYIEISTQIANRIKKLPTIDLTNLSGSNKNSIDQLFYGLRKIKTLPKIIIEFNDTVSINGVCNNCESLTNIDTLIDILKNKKITSMNTSFKRCKNLDFSFLSELNTDELINLIDCFYESNITEVPLFNTENVTSMSGCFEGCTKLLTIPQFNTAKCKSFYNLFYGTTHLTSLPELDFSSANNINYILYQNKLDLTNLGGFKNLGFSYNQKSTNYSNYTLDLSSCPALIKESVLNVFNDLYDLNKAYEGDPTPYTQQVKLHANVKALLSEEDIAIATNKGWTVV